MTLSIIFGAIGACVAGWVFWLLITQIRFNDDQAVKHELHMQSMEKGTDANGGVTCLRNALDI